MLGKILIAIGAFTSLVLTVAAFQPEDFSIERSVVIGAPSDVPFSYVNDFRKWALWSPWEEKDLSMKKTFEGPDTGVGSAMTWAGNKDVGTGKMTVLESVRNSLIKIDLEFTEPFAAKNLSEFHFMAEGAQTTVTWRMSGKNAYMSKLFGLLMNMDKMIGKDFERGLEKIKALSEAPAAQ